MGFTRRGNITEDFKVPYRDEPGGYLAEKFQYHSEHERSGGASLIAASSGIEGGVEISLASAESFFLSVASCDLVRMKAKHDVAEMLRDEPEWRFLKYFVVGELFRGRDLVFFGSEQGGRAVAVCGSTPDVTAFTAAGKVGASVRFATSGSVGLQFHGAPGEPVSFAVNVFRVRRVGDLVALSFALDDPLTDVADLDEVL